MCTWRHTLGVRPMSWSWSETGVCVYICLCVSHSLGVHVEAQFGCEAQELVMVGERCVCIYVCVCAVCM